MVSFTFDDVLASAATCGAALLERYGARGTFFAASSFTGNHGLMGPFATDQQLCSLDYRGHELACHTWSHLNCGLAGADALAADCDRNAKHFAAAGLPQPRNFSYPFGDISSAAKQSLGSRFKLLRALHPGVITSGTDLNQAPAVGIEGPQGEARAEQWLLQAAVQKGWLILYTHDVAEDCSQFGCTPAALEHLLEAARLLGFDIVTVAEGARRLNL
jgi:peptidoglycan/xylan/chitin deacetylase (PgdA/CDA1 family)